MPEIVPMMALSTGHVSKDTLEWLDGLNWEQEGPAGGKIAYGWFTYAHDDNMCHPTAPHAPDGQFPPDLWDCFEYARKHRCAYIRFDCDVTPVDDLPVYEHEH